MKSSGIIKYKELMITNRDVVCDIHGRGSQLLSGWYEEL